MTRRIVSAGVLLAFLCGCTLTPSTRQVTLYDELGAEAGLAKIVDAFIENIGNDAQIFPYFADAKVSRFRDMFLMHLCAVADGPCSYTGDSMEDIHTGMHINEADFNRVVELLVSAMTEARVPFTTQNKLLARLAPLRGAVIHR